MKLILATNKSNLYFVQLPNHFNRDMLPELLHDVETDLLLDETTVKFTLHSDEHLTDYERKQIDIHGEIIKPIQQLAFNNQ